MARYIDADAMIKRLEKWNTSDDMDKALYNFALNRINEQPTADVVEREKILKWIEEKKAEARNEI